ARRVLHIVIWAAAISVELSQFQALRVISAGLLASAGISGIIVGFAARGTLGNAIAGLTISITQPIRIGDDVELRGERGIVEDIHFTYTVLRLGDGRRLIIPNDAPAADRLVQKALARAAQVVFRRAL